MDAMGVEAILGGASLVSGLFKGSAAKKQAKAAEQQKKDELALQTRIYDEGTARLQPRVDAGNNALDAYLYEIGLGPKPTVGGETPTVETFRTPGARATQQQIMNGGVTARNAHDLRTGAGTTGYRVGSETFSSAEEAQAYADSHKTGGTEYGGYEVSPMAQYLLKDGVSSIEGSRAAAGGLYSGATLKALEDNRRELITADTSDYFNRLLGVADRGQAAATGQNDLGQNYASGSASAGRYGTNGQIDAYGNLAEAATSTIDDLSGIYGYFQGDKKPNPLGAYAANYASGR